MNEIREIKPMFQIVKVPTAVIGFLVVLMLAGCNDKPGSMMPPSAPPDVVVTEVVQKSIPIVMEFAGTVKSVKAVNVIPRVSGYIVKRYFEEGTFLQDGDPLYLIDPEPFKVRVKFRQAELEEDQSLLTYWMKESDRLTRLVKKGVAAKTDEEHAIARHGEMLAAVAKGKAALEEAKLDLRYTKITAPFDGRIEDTLFYEGDLVKEHRDTLTTMVQIDPIYVIFEMSRREVSEVQRLIAKGWAPTEMEKYTAVVLLPDGSVYPHEGNLEFISAQFNPATDTHKMRVVFPNPLRAGGTIANAALISGQYVPIRLTIGQQPDAELIPQSALVQSQIGAHVFVVDKDNRVEIRRVEVDRTHRQQWVIREGLEKGERVIVKGTQKVRSGMIVNSKTEESAKKHTS